MTRRVIDVLVALVVLIVLSPILLLLSVAIVVDSWGSPFYRAPRVGKDGRRFRMWKLRTMIRRAAELGPSITGSGDDRMTRLGGLLRRLKLDELPQFVNVLVGDMTLVGPRPETPGIVAQYSERQRRTLQVKPGITGPDQVLRGEESESIPEGVDPERFYVENLLDEKLERALAYIDQRSLRGDLVILGRTLLHIPRSLTPSRAQPR